VLHVFVDLDTGDPQLYVASSSHPRSVPNNEFLDPNPDAIPRVLSRARLALQHPLGQREPPASSSASARRGCSRTSRTRRSTRSRTSSGFPSRTGSPRRGDAAPSVVPEYEGEPLYDHPDLPSVSVESLVDGALTIRSLDALGSPPTDLPFRETGIAFRHADREDELADRTADEVIGYDLVQSAELEDITAFTGPQLSYEFAVPKIVEDAVASHITTTGIPWKQPRYENPALDVTAGNHRAELAERYDAIAAEESFGDGATAELDAVVARVTRAVESDDAPEGEGLTTTDAITESFVLIESDPEAVPTFGGGIAVANGIPEGDHRLTVNGAGRRPPARSWRSRRTSPLTTAGVDGEIPLVARENATKVELSDAESDIDMTRTAVEDDFAGRIYDSAVDGSDAVYVHAGGAYTTEVRDADDDEIGAYRIKPAPEAADPIRTDPNRPARNWRGLARRVRRRRGRGDAGGGGGGCGRKRRRR